MHQQVLHVLGRGIRCPAFMGNTPGYNSSEVQMSKSRRHFVADATLGILSAAATACRIKEEVGEQPAGTPPAFGTAPPVGPEVSPSTFAEAEKLVQVDLRSSD